MKHASILATIGRTPAIKLNRLAPAGVDVWVKLEAFNPLGSVKDRLALGVIEAAERDGSLKPGQTVVEATSGNTGIGLAMVCAAKGYPLVITMAESFSVERRKLMRFLGAKVVLTPAALKGTGMVQKARELAEANGWFWTRQFENEANPDFHSKTTAREILEDFSGERLDWWVTGAGTGGTLLGVARVLRRERPEVKIGVCEPDNAQILASGHAQMRNPDGTPAESHPAWRPHLLQGWTPDFVPKISGDALAGKFVDELLPVTGNDAMRLSRELAQQEGIFAGTSGGGTLAGALRIAERSPQGTVILAMLPDTAERYLSTPLFEQVGADMDESEWALSRSTPGARFDGRAVPAPAAAPAAIDPGAERLVERLLADPAKPIAFFALQWCEFCWSVRRLLQAAGVAFESVDLDAVAMQEGDLGAKVRAVLAKRLGTPTIPQIFVGGEHVGGATETMDAFNSGRLQELFRRHGVAFDAGFRADAYSFLPQWLQKRSL
ncbi:MAG TPA: pyridoxal-phosphate dependent enzyme [Steroidobacteraceae bacterium]|nr:pyridoxal-phosphate dependent enzyme [Steroidobacteraceae bacterium]